LAKNPLYNNVGVVKQKMKTLFPWRGEGCQGRPFFGRSSRPWTGLSAPTQSNRERSATQFSWASFLSRILLSASDQDSSPGILDGTAYSTSHLFDLQSKTM